MIFFILLPLFLFLLARWMQRRHMGHIESSLDSCECMAIQRRAEKMHAAVDSKIRAMDSRDPDKPLASPTPPAEPPTVEVPKLIAPPDDSERAAITIRLVAALALFAGVLLAGWLIGSRPVQTREGVIKSSPAVKVVAAKSFNERLADLKYKPTLLTIGWFERTQLIPERRREVAAVLEAVAQSGDPDNVRAAVAALGKWGTAESIPVVLGVFKRERGQTKRYAELTLAQLP